MNITADLLHEGSGFCMTECKIAVDGEAIAEAEITMMLMNFPTPELAAEVRRRAELVGMLTTDERVKGAGPPMTREVWITGIGLVSSLGEGVDAHWQAMAETDPPRPVVDMTSFAPFPVHPLVKLDFDKQIPKRGDQRQMENWQRVGTYTAGLALDDAGIAGNAEILSRTNMVVAAAGGERDLAVDATILEGIGAAAAPDEFINERLSNDLRPTLFLAQLPNLVAGNIAIVHKVTGSSRTFMGEELASVSAVEIAARRIRAGQGDIFLAGGALIAERKDVLLVVAGAGWAWTGAPISVWAMPDRGGGLVLGSVGAFLVLEAREHAEARGKKPYAQTRHDPVGSKPTGSRRGRGQCGAAIRRDPQGSRRPASRRADERARPGRADARGARLPRRIAGARRDRYSPGDGEHARHQRRGDISRRWSGLPRSRFRGAASTGRRTRAASRRRQPRRRRESSSIPGAAGAARAWASSRRWTEAGLSGRLAQSGRR